MKRATLMMLLAGPVHGFELRHDSEGEVVRWTEAPHFVVDANLDARLGASGAAEAVRAAVSRWADALPGLGLAVEVGEAQAAGFTLTGDNQCSITALTDEWPYDEHVLAVTLVTVDHASHRIIDADIVLNAAQNRFGVLAASSVRGGRLADVQNTATHELGHALGLQHELMHPEAVMFPMAFDGDVDKRALSSDDLAGLDALYPVAAPQAGCSSSGAALTTALAAAVLARRRGARRTTGGGR